MVQLKNICAPSIDNNLILTRSSKKTENRLNAHFQQRFGRNSKFGQEHIGISQKFTIKLVSLAVFVFVAIDLTYQIVLEPMDYNITVGATFYAFSEVSSCILFAVVCPSLFLLQDGKQKKGLMKALKDMKFRTQRVGPVTN